VSDNTAGWFLERRGRVRNDTTPNRPADVINLAPVYSIHDNGRTAVLNPFQVEQKPGWWDAVSKDALVDDALVYVELESDAAKVRTFKIDLIDGLLQTADYASAVVRANLPRATDSFVRQRVDVRSKRQARLTGANPIHIEAILTEGALRTQVGGPEVMRGQLEHLVALGRQSNVDLRVIPATGAYPAMGTPFYILSFEDIYPNVGYVELLDKGVYLEEPDDVEPYLHRFDALRELALDPVRTSEFIAAIAGSMTSE
jgi:hypothetical protein